MSKVSDEGCTVCLCMMLCSTDILFPWHVCGLYVCAQGYDISFLITNFHCAEMYKHKVVDFVIQFMVRSCVVSRPARYVTHTAVWWPPSLGLSLSVSLFGGVCAQEDIDKEISEMRLAVNARARVVSEEFLKQFAQ